jgi:hypothetical protein
VSVLAVGTKLPNEPGNVFIADGDHGGINTGNEGELKLRLRWAGDKELVINYPKRARLFRSEEHIGGIHVAYEPIE